MTLIHLEVTGSIGNGKAYSAYFIETTRQGLILPAEGESIGDAMLAIVAAASRSNGGFNLARFTSLMSSANPLWTGWVKPGAMVAWRQEDVDLTADDADLCLSMTTADDLFEIIRSNVPGIYPGDASLSAFSMAPRHILSETRADWSLHEQPRDWLETHELAVKAPRSRTVALWSIAFGALQEAQSAAFAENDLPKLIYHGAALCAQAIPGWGGAIASRPGAAVDLLVGMRATMLATGFIRGNRSWLPWRSVLDRTATPYIDACPQNLVQIGRRAAAILESLDKADRENLVATVIAADIAKARLTAHERARIAGVRTRAIAELKAIARA